MYLNYLEWLSCLRLDGVKELEEKPIRDTSGGLSRSLDLSVRRGLWFPIWEILALFIDSSPD